MPIFLFEDLFYYKMLLLKFCQSLSDSVTVMLKHPHEVGTATASIFILTPEMGLL